VGPGAFVMICRILGMALVEVTDKLTEPHEEVQWAVGRQPLIQN